MDELYGSSALSTLLGGAGSDDLSSNSGGLLGFLRDPQTLAGLGMILKGFSPHSAIDPQAMLQQAYRLKLAQEERKREEARHKEMMDFRRSEAGRQADQFNRSLGLDQRRIDLDQGRFDRSLSLDQQKMDAVRQEQSQDAAVYADIPPGGITEDYVRSVLAKPGLSRSTRDAFEAKLKELSQNKTMPGEHAARIALADNYLGKAPKIEEAIKRGDLTGPVDQQLASRGFGNKGQVYADIESGVDALRRGLTGQGMPQAEADDYARRYLPTWRDTAGTLLQKHQRLVSELQRFKANTEQGRGPSASSRMGAPTTSGTNAEGKRLRFNPATGEFE